MLLRDHPLKSRHGVPNWPPLGTWISELENTRPKREIGVLKSQAQNSFNFCCNRSIADIDLASALPTGIAVAEKKEKQKEERKYGNKTKNKTASLCNTRIVLDGWDQRSSILPLHLRPTTNH
jgi:hypothetical protein